jgi:hypothetical protein
MTVDVIPWKRLKSNRVSRITARQGRIPEVVKQRKEALALVAWVNDVVG